VHSFAYAVLTASQSASTGSNGTTSVSSLPAWLLVALLSVVGLVIILMFGLTAYSLGAPRSTLKNALATKRGQEFRPDVVTKELVSKLAMSARSGRRTTRATLAIVGFALLGVIVVAVFGLSGQGVEDIRSQVAAAVTTLAATIAGFYFGAQTADSGSANQSQANQSQANQSQANQGQANQGQANQGQANQGQANQGQANQGQANQGQADPGQADQG
jgi:hypothetical protein